jgi:hypothetical protein
MTILDFFEYEGRVSRFTLDFAVSSAGENKTKARARLIKDFFMTDPPV